MKLHRCALFFTTLLCGFSACSDKEKPAPPGELILALQTDMQLPKDVDKVRIRIASFGNTLFSNDYQVGPNDLKIPATLGLLANPDHPSSPVTIQVIAFQQGKPRVLRETITTVPADRLATLRVPIEWLCDDSAKMVDGEPVSACPEGETCSTGVCVPSAADSSMFPTYAASDIFGGGDGSGNGACFDVGPCFSNNVVLTVDMTTCRATVPAMSPNLNVALKLPGTGDGICSGGLCLIPLDGGEGGQWSLPSGSSSIQLPKAACDRLGAGKVEAVLASTACPTKTAKTPTCGPWSSSGGDSHVTPDGGITGSTDGGSSADVGAPKDGAGLDVSVDSSVQADSGSDGGSPLADAGKGGPDAPADGGCFQDNCGAPPACNPPPPDAGVCMGVVSRPAPIGTCRWSIPGSIMTGGPGFCPNLVNVQLTNMLMPPPMMLQQVQEGACSDFPGWQYIMGGTVLELCPAACSMSMNPDVAVDFNYGCPSMGQPVGPPPDAGAGTVSMRPILGGTFMMGCVAGDQNCNTDELPNHAVTVSDFSIDETEVSQGAYDACLRASVCVAPPCSSWSPGTKANWPVTCVSWDEADKYCNWLGKRLPTEAEWEIAARGMSQTQFPWGDQAPDCTRANFSLCAFNSPQAVRSFAAGSSFFGAYDMAGNVAEWVSDWYGPMYDAAPPTNPTGPPSGSQHVVRGGDYSSAAVDLRASRRQSALTATRVDTIGFRCAKPGF